MRGTYNDAIRFPKTFGKNKIDSFIVIYLIAACECYSERVAIREQLAECVLFSQNTIEVLWIKHWDKCPYLLSYLAGSLFF